MSSTWRDAVYVVANGEMVGGWNQWPFHAVDVRRDQETAFCGLRPAEGWGVKLTRSPGSMLICGTCSDLERPRTATPTAGQRANGGR